MKTIKSDIFSPRKKLLTLTITTILSTCATLSYADEIANDAKEEVESIVITGSRIARVGVETASPVVSLSSSDLNITGSMNVADVLAALPQFAQGMDAASSSYSPADVGLFTTNLRDLGSHRTLVLIDGHRPTQTVDSGGRMITDLGNIPGLLIERVEILTGGASSVYGSDALAGVVNIILKKAYVGSSLNTQISSTERGDGESATINFTHGLNFNDNRGNLVFNIDYFKQKELTFASRPGSNGGTGYVANPLDPDADIDGVPDQIVLNNIGWADYYITADRPTVMMGNSYDYYQFNRNSDGSLGDGFLAITDAELHDYYKQSHDINPNMYSSVGNVQAIQPYKKLSAYVSSHYSFDNEIDLFADVNYSKQTAKINIGPEFLYSWNAWVNVNDAPFDMPQQVIDAAQAEGTNWVAIPYTFNDFGSRRNVVDREFISSALGLSGYFANEWSWDSYISLGKTTVDNTQYGALNSDHYNADSGNNPFVLIGECQQTNSCAEFNPFMPLSAEAVDYMRLAPYTDVSETYQMMIAGNISGDIASLPAGDLMFSAGIELRQEGLEATSSDVSLNGTNRGQTKAETDVERDIKEAYVEIVAPLLSDVPFVKTLDVEAAYRVANYTYAGTNNSWKVGTNWAIDNNIRFRAIYSKAVRAPQLTELLRPEEIGFSRYQDPCDIDEIKYEADDIALRTANCLALGVPENFEADTRLTTGTNSTVKGNPDLAVESAHTLTVGLVLTPEMIENFDISFDYYDIDIKDGINRFGVLQTAEMCVDAASIDNQYCPQVTREADGNISNVNDTYINSNKLVRRGLDVQAHYSYTLAGAGELDLTWYATKLFENSFTESDLAGAEQKEYVGVNGTPEWKSSLITRYDYRDFSFSWIMNYTKNTRYSLTATAEKYERHIIPSSVINNIRVSYNLNDNANIYAGINNVGDRNWIGIPGVSKGTAAYPIYGRSFYAGIKYNF